MPFFAPIDDKWCATVDVGLMQLGDSGAKPLFRVLTSFGYVPRETLLRSGQDGSIPPAENRRVHENDRTDLASVPPFLWGVIASYGNHTMPALLHDRLCDDARKQPRGVRLAERRDADEVFRTMLRDEAHLGAVTRWIMWAAVRLFGVIAIGVAAVAVSLLALLLLYGDAAWERGVHVALFVSAAVLLGLMMWASLESAPSGRHSFRLSSFAEWVVAALVGGMALLPLLPVILVTIGTRIMLWVADLVVFGLYVIVVEFPWWLWRSATYPRVDTSLEPAAGDEAEPAPPRRLPAFRVTAEPLPAFGRMFPRL